ncbi:hypothetical protein FRC09_003566 [Ceratobasidium sp. 395]|nr:hypothetical protein FRC09_003566 [Ceratobasidium sp. 395]
MPPFAVSSLLMLGSLVFLTLLSNSNPAQCPTRPMNGTPRYIWSNTHCCDEPHNISEESRELSDVNSIRALGMAVGIGKAFQLDCVTLPAGEIDDLLGFKKLEAIRWVGDIDGSELVVRAVSKPV